MASYNELNALIDAYINRNGVQAITGQILNGVLKAMVEQLGRGYTIMGAAIPTTDPGTPDGPECYFASETGTYTDFDGLQVAPGELALLCYTPSDGWTKATIYEGFQEVGATIDGNVGIPSVGVSYAGGVLSFDFHDMKGNPGQNGQDGAAAGFGTIGADITGGVGTPGVTVESSGPATAKNLQFHFTNLKGETGVTSVVATVDNTIGTPACTVSLVGQQLTLAFTGLKGAQGDTGSSVDYPFTIVNNLTTDDATQALSAAQGVVLDGKVSQLEAKVSGLDGNVVYGESYKYDGSAITNDGWFRSTDYVPVARMDSVTWNPGLTPTAANNACLIVYDENKVVIDFWQSSATERTFTITKAGTAFMRACFAESNKQNAKLIVNGTVVWSPVDTVVGLEQSVAALDERVTDAEEEVSNIGQVVDTAIESVEKVVAHHKETITYSSTLAVESGGQTLLFEGVNFRVGRKYTITAESDTDNTGYLNFQIITVSGASTNITGMVWQNINDNPYSLILTPTENYGDFSLYIRGISVSGNVTITIVEEWDETNAGTGADVLVKSPGKNLADPKYFVSGRTIFVYSGRTVAQASSLYGTGRAITGYIPIKNGQTLVCNVSAGIDTYNYAALFKEVGDLVAIPGTEVRVNTNVVRTITNNLGYDAYAVFTIADTATEVQVELGNTPTFYEEYFALHGYMPEDGIDISSYGIMQTYPDELKKVESSLKNNHSGTKLHFVHLSDNHGGSFGNADVFTDPSPASFLVNTGDLVADKYSDSYDTTKGLILAMTKPGYVTLGNHDCYNSTSLQARFEKFIEPLNTHNGLTGNTKTYYSVDFATEKVKCIFLDMNDGYGDTTGLGMNYLVAGKMSSEQINWFATELQSAKTNGYDVAVFIHISPDYVDTDRMENSFYDGQVAKATGVSFLCDMVDGFINGGTVSFTADEVDYSFTFVAGGKFAGWFCGHTHYDSFGWLKDHPKQFSCSVARPYRNSDSQDGTYRIPKLGVAWDYVTINANTHTMSILRMGNNETIYGTIRDAFYIKY